MKYNKKLLPLGAVLIVGIIPSMILSARLGTVDMPLNIPPKYPVPAMIRLIAKENPREYGAPLVRVNDPQKFIQNASELMEYEVRNDEDERLGTFNDVLFDAENGQIEFVGVGPGEPLRLVPPQALEPNPAEQNLVLRIDTDRWEEAPTAERNELGRLALQDEASDVYSYYGLNYRSAVTPQTEQQEFAAPSRREQMGRWDRDLAPYRSRPGILPPDLLPGDPRVLRSQPRALPPDREEVQEELRAEREFGSPRERAMRDPDAEERDLNVAREIREREEADPTLRNPRMGQTHRGTERLPRQSAERDTPTEFGQPPDRQDRLVWASDLLRQVVTGPDQEVMGEVVDLIVDLHVGYVQHVIVSYNGTDPQTFAIPVRDIEIGEAGQVIIERDLADLQDAPNFEPRIARLRRFEPFRYDAPAGIQFGDPSREPEETETSENAIEDQL